MGVQSLWQLLHPVGRPVLLETMEGKRMAIDSSIWIYQFQATMRDKDGHGLTNAHVLGFLRRITKLLFYGIKPVFVFDGGAPALKRNTLVRRKEKKRGAAMTHAKLAEKLLAAQLRREAVTQTSSQRKRKSQANPEANDTIFFEDLDPDSIQSKPAPSKSPTTPAKRKSRYGDSDPYHLPDVDMPSRVSKATQSQAPDPRLATEDELRTFIDEMKPEDFDVTSEAFRELPTEVQYEIVGDLRLKSRQTSYTRLQNMLRSSKTPMDFSKQQIANLKQRNTLTQQLLTTTNDIGRAHISIPIRIASERNKEYVLIKNDGPSGGWVLGIHDDVGTTQDRPIEIDTPDSHAKVAPAVDGSDDGDSDMEEVQIPQSQTRDLESPDHSRGTALSNVVGRSLWDKDPDRGLEPSLTIIGSSSIGISQSVEDEEDPDLAFAIQASIDENTAYFVEDTRLATTLSIAGAGPSRSHFFQNGQSPSSPRESPISTRKTGTTSSSPATTKSSSRKYSFGTPLFSGPSGEAKNTEVKEDNRQNHNQPLFLDDGAISDQDVEMVPVNIPATSATDPLSLRSHASPHIIDAHHGKNKSSAVGSASSSAGISVPHAPKGMPTDVGVTPPQREEQTETRMGSLHEQAAGLNIVQRHARLVTVPQESTMPDDTLDDMYTSEPPSPKPNVTGDDEGRDTPRDQHHSPMEDEETHQLSAIDPPNVESGEGWDAAQEMDPQLEEADFAQFLSEVRGRDLDAVQREIEAEIRDLHKQQKQAMRDSEDVNSQMVAQIMTMLRLFGIPYITAPMEAEAQCAELVELDLVDGVITDDSDVFLFGAQRVFKNMFNQSKTVECFLLTDLVRELGLDRDTLVRLAYLLGSDYTEGLPGVGPVLAMELLKEFPGENGLHEFSSWWSKVQMGQDKEQDTGSPFKKRFKKRFKELYLGSDWPNPAVRDAYYHPTVDSSEEQFKWGLPDLDALRSFLASELGWKKDKVDDLILPIISKMGKRSQPSATNAQSNLNQYLDISGGSGTFAPRQRHSFQSKRLQQVISDFRRSKRTRSSDEHGAENGSDTDPVEESSAACPPPRKRATTKRKKSNSETPTTRRPSGNSSKARRKPLNEPKEDSQSGGSTDEYQEGDVTIPDKPLDIRLRPKPRAKPVTSSSASTD